MGLQTVRVMVPHRPGDRTVPISLSEEIHSLTHATKLLPARRGGRPTHASCLFRWARHGLRGIKLKPLGCGETLCPSRKALELFSARLAELDTPDAAGDEIPSPRRQEIAEASREAEAALR